MAVFKTGCIQLDLLSPARVEVYMDTIKKYNARYTHTCWHLIYQADVRMRLEQAERIRRVGQAERVSAQARNLLHDFDPVKPWEWVWARMPEDTKFWREELEEPCMLVLQRSGSISNMISGDAPVASDGGSSKRNQHGPAPGPKKKAKKAPRVHNVSDGVYTTNRRSIQLCADFNKGTCTETTANHRCSRNPSLSHQCSKCLEYHPGDIPGRPCNKTPRQPSQGKGKGKGKKGKGKWQY